MTLRRTIAKVLRKQYWGGVQMTFSWKKLFVRRCLIPRRFLRWFWICHLFCFQIELWRWKLIDTDTNFYDFTYFSINIGKNPNFSIVQQYSKNWTRYFWMVETSVSKWDETFGLISTHWKCNRLTKMLIHIKSEAFSVYLYVTEIASLN
jgi:hypothetical protein